MDEFDPYLKWLGIPPTDRPLTHYRLLGLRPGESDPEVIANAADQRMTFVRTFQTGPHSDRSQELLNQLAAARVCLLHPARKVDYDQLLAAESPPPDRVAAAESIQPLGTPAAAVPMGIAVVAVPMAAPAAPGDLVSATETLPAVDAHAVVPRVRPVRILRHRRRGPAAALLVIVAGLSLLLAVLIVLLHRPAGESRPKSEPPAATRGARGDQADRGGRPEDNSASP